MKALQLPGARTLFYFAIGHGLVGVVTGGIFPIRALLALVALTAIESVVVAALFGLPAGLWSLVNLATIQIGYLGGICVRGLLERAGLAEPATRVHHT